MPVRAEYDREADALYVYLQERQGVARTLEYDWACSVDLDADGGVVGFEVLSPHRNLRLGAVAERFDFLDRYEEIEAAISTALPAAPTYAVNIEPPFTLTNVTAVPGGAYEATLATGTISLGDTITRGDDAETGDNKPVEVASA